MSGADVRRPGRLRWPLPAAVLAAVLGMLGYAAYRERELAAVRTNLARVGEVQERLAGDKQLLLNDGRRVAESFLRDAREGRLDAAYAATTAGYRARTGRGTFADLVARHPALRAPLAQPETVVRGGSVDADLSSGRIDHEPPRMEYRAAAAGERPGRVELVLVVEGGAVKVDACAEPEEP